MSAPSAPTSKSKPKATRNPAKERDKTKDHEKDKEGDTSKEEKLDRLKTVVRRLPPNLPEDVFWQSVQTWVTDESVSWKLFYPGKVGKRLNKENIPSRAYIAFKSEDQLALFSQGYDGHLFRDKAGNESTAVVEFAPYQKIPTEKKKTDARSGTIEKDEDYLSFLESLNNKGSVPGESGESASLESLIAATQPAPQPKTTPLLEALKAQKEKEKEAAAARTIARKEIQMAAAAASTSHGKDLAAAGGKKDGEKKGMKGAKPQAQGGVEPSTPGKKVGKKGKVAQQIAAAQAKAGPSTSTPAVPAPVPAKSTQKPPRQPRPSQTQVPVHPVHPPGDPLASSQASASALGAGGSGEGGQPPQVQRRARPVIPSRGFEAALSGAGVGVASTRSQGRKEKKEKEDASGEAGVDSGIGKEGAKEQPHMTRKEREREREKRRKEKEELISRAGGSANAAAVASGGGPGTGTGGGSVLPAPTILTHAAPPKILARPATDGASSGVASGAGGVLNVNPNTVATGAPSGAGSGGDMRGGGRGGRRGRGGRGRGRGVA